MVSMPYGPGETEVWTTYAYDVSGRQLTATRPDGSVTTNIYTGNSVKVTDAAGKYKTYTNDAAGNLLTVVEPDPNSSGTLPTYYAYNAANQLTQVSMTRSGVTQTRNFTWSGSDLASSSNPENRTVTYTYDGNHHITQRTDAKGQMTQYSYDAYERLVQTRHYACSGTCGGDFSQVNYTYDTAVDWPTYQYTQNTMGRLSTVAFTGHNTNSANGYEYQYSYNTAGRVIGQTLWITNNGNIYVPTSVWATANYAWDAYGRVTQTTTPGGTVLNYQYDAMSRLSSISETPPGGQAFTAASANYNSASLITSLTYGPSGSQFAENRTYNNLLQMTRATVTASAGTLMDMQYVFPSGSNNGKVSQTIDGVLGETVTYQYDALNRLIAATASNNSWGEAYGFDGFGNLQSKTPTVGSAPTGGGANPATNQPTGVSVDSNGNTLGTGSTNQWDVENRLMASPVSGQMAYYDYDPWGKRVFKDNQYVSGTVANLRSLLLRLRRPEAGDIHGQLRL